MWQLNDKKVALVHDFLTAYGGAERVLEVLAEMFPEAPIYTLLYDKEKMRGRFADREIRTSFLHKFPRFLRKRQQWLLPFLSTAPETLDLRDFDLVISSSGAWSKGIITKLNTIHVAYIHSPMRFVWDYNNRYLKEHRKEKFKWLVRPFLSHLRIWDRQAADRPDFLIANSRYTQKRIEKYYRRESAVIYPPVGNSKFKISNFNSNQNIKNSNLKIDSKFPPKADQPQADKIQNSKFFLVVSRLSAPKRVDVAVEAFGKLGLPLVVVGEGKERKRLEKMAADNVRFVGWQSEEKLAKIYSNARALIFPSLDDFGMTMAEAMGHGVPVIAYRGGGALEVVEEGVTGEFFAAQTPEVLADGVRRFIEKGERYDPEAVRKSAERFSKEKFIKEIEEFISSKI